MRLVIQNENREDIGFLLGEAYSQAARKAESFSHISNKLKVYTNDNVIIYETNTTASAKYIIYDVEHNVSYPLHSIKWMKIGTVEITKDFVNVYVVAHWLGYAYKENHSEYRRFQIKIDRKYSKIEYIDLGIVYNYRDYIWQ